jgi:butyrate kinase
MKSKIFTILALNFGSTSSKLAVYKNKTPVFGRSLAHPREELAAFPNVRAQYDYRREAVSEALREHGFFFGDFDILVSRGGNTRPVPGGIYLVDEAMLADIDSGYYGVHATGNGNRLVYEVGKKYGIPAICVDPPVSDEFCDEARFTGLPEIWRRSSGHVLNQKATARKIAAQLGKNYQECALIICHLGGGISIAAHRQGRIVDMNDALDGDGPMAPERAGSLPARALAELCFSGRWTREAIRNKLAGQGGWMAHLGFADGRELVRRVKAGDEAAVRLLNATLYQIAKEIGAMAAVLGQGGAALDGIGLTGSLAHSREIVNGLRERSAWLKAPVFVHAGENEMEALGAGALRYLRGEERAMKFSDAGDFIFQPAGNP